MIRMLAVLVVALGLAAPAVVAQEAGKPAARQTAPAKTTRIVMRVNGLSCPFCAYGLEKKLKTLDAVKDIDVKLKEGRVYLDLEPGQTVSDEALAKMVEESGFVLRGIERSPAPGASR